MAPKDNLMWYYEPSFLITSENLVEGKRSRRGTPSSGKTPRTIPRKSSKVEEKKFEFASGKRDTRYGKIY